MFREFWVVSEGTYGISRNFREFQEDFQGSFRGFSEILEDTKVFQRVSCGPNSFFRSFQGRLKRML